MYYSLKEVSRLLGVTIRTLYYWEKQGRFKFAYIGGQTVFDEEEYKKILDFKSKFFQLKDASKMMGITINTAYKWVESKKLKYIVDNNIYLIPIEEINRVRKYLDKTKSFYKLQEVADELGLTSKTLTTWRDKGVFKIEKVLNKNLIPPKEHDKILEYMKEKKNKWQI